MTELVYPAEERFWDQVKGIYPAEHIGSPSEDEKKVSLHKPTHRKELTEGMVLQESMAFIKQHAVRPSSDCYGSVDYSAPARTDESIYNEVGRVYGSTVMAHCLVEGLEPPQIIIN